MARETEPIEVRVCASSTEVSAAPVSQRAAALALVVILVLVFLAYLDTLWFQFVHDDQFQIVRNTWLRSWRYLPRYFTADVWAFNHPAFRGTFYRPVFLLWFRLQYLAFGLRPWGWHLCTVLAHVGVTALVYYTSVRLLKDRLAALIATLIFGLHPTHAEGVAWISGVTEPLFALFVISSYLCYLKKRTERPYARAYLAASLALYALATLAKETAVVLPLIIFASEFIWSAPTATSRLRGGFQRGVAALAVVTPYLVLSAAYLALRVMALQGFQNSMESHRFFSMVLTWPSVLWFYIRHLIWPVRLSPFYDMEYVVQAGVRNVLLPALAVLIVGAGLWLWGRRSQQAALATVWLVVPILPVLNLQAFVEGHLVHDRYLYLPSFGFALLVALGLRRLQIGSARLLGQPAPQIALGVVLALALATSTTQQTACFATDTTFFAYLISTSSKSESAKLNLAGLLGHQGHLDEAIRLYQEVWSSEPDNWEVNYNLGYAYYLQGKLPEANRYLSRAVQIDASRPDGFFYLGLTRLKMGDVNGAAADVQRAITIRPDAEHYHFALGAILRLQGNLTGALSEFRTELELDPDNAAARQQAAEIEAARGGGQPAAPPGSTPVPFSSPRH